MNLMDYLNGLTGIYQQKLAEKGKLERLICNLECNPAVRDYLKYKEELANLNIKYSKYAYESNSKLECNHGIYYFCFDLCSLNYAHPAVRCLKCGKWLDVDNEKLNELYDAKRVVAKKVEPNRNGFEFQRVDYDVDFETVRKIYFDLFKKSNEGELFNVENYLFDHLTNNNPNVIYTESYNNKPGVHINEQEFWNEFRQMLSENPKLLEVDEKGMVRTKKKSYNPKSK